MSTPAGLSAISLPSDLTALLKEIDDANLHASVLVSQLNDNQANWQPDQGAAWSVAQCLDHMAATNRVYLRTLQTAAAHARPGHTKLQPAGWLSRYFLKKAEPPVSLKIKAPSKIQPPSTISKNDALAHFQQSNVDVRQFTIETAGLDLCSIRFKNPFVPLLNFTVATGLLVIAAHNRRHLWQAEQVVKREDFPR